MTHIKSCQGEENRKLVQITRIVHHFPLSITANQQKNVRVHFICLERSRPTRDERAFCSKKLRAFLITNLYFCSIQSPNERMPSRLLLTHFQSFFTFCSFFSFSFLTHFYRNYSLCRWCIRHMWNHITTFARTTHTHTQHSDALEISLVSIFTLVIPRGKIGRVGRVKVAIHSTYK